MNNDRRFVDDAQLEVAEVWQPQGNVWGFIVSTCLPSAWPGQRYRHLEPKHWLKGSELKAYLSHLPVLKFSGVHTWWWLSQALLWAFLVHSIIFIHAPKEAEYVVFCLTYEEKEFSRFFELDPVTKWKSQDLGKIRLDILGIEFYQMVITSLASSQTFISQVEIAYHPGFPDLITCFSFFPLQMPEDLLVQHLNNQLPAYRIRLDSSVPVLEHLSAKGPESKWCYLDQLSCRAPSSSAGESCRHSWRAGLKPVWDHGLPPHGHPSCPEQLLPAQGPQLVWKPHLHDCPGESPASYWWVVCSKSRALSCPSGELQLSGYSSPGETCPAKSWALGDPYRLGTSQEDLG